MSAHFTATEDEVHRPFLHRSIPPSNGLDEEIAPSLSSNSPELLPPPRNQRLISLDVFRGLTVAVCNYDLNS